MATHEVTLDVAKQSAMPSVIMARVGESNLTIKATIKDRGTALSLSSATVRFVAVKPDRTYADQSASKSGSVATVTLDPKFLSVPGNIKTAYFRIESGGKVDTTENVWITVLPDGECSTTGPTDPYISTVEELIKDLNALKSTMQTATNSANTAADNANDAASDATEAAQICNAATDNAEDATAAANKAASAAQGAAGNANDAANYAQTVADSLSSTVVGDEDVAEMKGQIDKLGSMVANANDEFFILGDTVYAPSSKASMSGDTVTLGGDCYMSGDTIYLV